MDTVTSTYVDRCQPYRVRMTCGHLEPRMMREATAGKPWTPMAVVDAPTAECWACRASKAAVHGIVQQCTAYDGHARCGQRAVCCIVAPDGVLVPGCFDCWDHATAALTEYQAKLGETWTAIGIAPCRAVYERTTETIRSYPENYCLAARNPGGWHVYRDEGATRKIHDVISAVLRHWPLGASAEALATTLGAIVEEEHKR